MTYYDCPICGYDSLIKPPANSYICPCCGTEFESDDFEKSPVELRAEWIEKDMPWFSRSTLQPKDWNSYRQLIRANFGIDLTTHPRFATDVNYRHAVNRAFSEVDIARQLRALRERENDPLTQSQLAAKADMKQSRISELEGMNYSSWSISTLERLAKALGVAFVYSFITWDELVSRMKGKVPKDTSPSRSIENAHTAIPEPAHVLPSQAGYAYQHGITVKMFALLPQEKNVVSMERHKQQREQIFADENSQKQKQQRDAATLSYSDTALVG